MTRHGSWNSVTTPVGISSDPGTLRHCGRCKNPFFNNPNCECHCHTAAREVERLREAFHRLRDQLADLEDTDEQ